MKRTAIFPGSFDPITRGHENVILRAAQLFDQVIVAVGNNSSKKCLFDIEKRVGFIEQTFVTNPKIEVDTFDGLTVEFLKNEQSTF